MSTNFLYYETLLLLKSDVTDMQVVSISKEITDIFKKHDAVEILFDNWGKLRLAYPVNKEDYGVYILVRYKVPSTTVHSCLNRLDQLFRVALNEVVSRHVNVAITQKQANDPYKKPSNIATSTADKSKLVSRFVSNVDIDGFGVQSGGESLGSSRLVVDDIENI